MKNRVSDSEKRKMDKKILLGIGSASITVAAITAITIPLTISNKHIMTAETNDSTGETFWLIGEDIEQKTEESFKGLTTEIPEVTVQKTKNSKVYISNLYSPRITSLKIDSITKLRHNGLRMLTGLKELILKNVEIIGDSAVALAPLEKLIIPNVKTIARSVFAKAKLTHLSLPVVTSIGLESFFQCRLKELDIPLVKKIGVGVFWHSALSKLSLPVVESIGSNAFQASRLTTLNIPKANMIGRLAFISIVNATTTKVTMKAKFNTDSEKNKIFGSGNWNNINFNII